MLWKKEDILNAVKTESKDVDLAQINGVSIDSRTTNEGDLFIAIMGDNNDGHEYVDQAFKKGAAAAIVQYMPDCENSEKLIFVEDTFDALWDLARYRRKQFNGKIILITGSVGKTSTKEMLAGSLQNQGKVHYTKGNYNNHYGLPLTMALMPADTDYAVLEVGMSSAGEISPLAVLVNPDVALITNVEAVHLEFFDSVEAIADAKSEIFDGLKKGATAIINRDNRHYLRVKENAIKKKVQDIRSFGRGEGAEYQLLNYIDETNSNKIEASINNKKIEYKISHNGLHMALNSVCVLGAVDAIGADIEKSIKALGELQPGAGRGEILPIDFNNGKVHIIDETYNSSPASVKASLAVLGAVKKQKLVRIIAILGDMLELGNDSIKMHGNLSEFVELNNVDVLITVGAFMKELNNNVSDDIEKYHFESSDEVFHAVKSNIKDGDVILIKGSRSMKMERFINDIKNGEKE